MIVTEGSVLTAFLAHCEKRFWILVFKPYP